MNYMILHNYDKPYFSEFVKTIMQGIKQTMPFKWFFNVGRMKQSECDNVKFSKAEPLCLFRPTSV